MKRPPPAERQGQRAHWKRVRSAVAVVGSSTAHHRQETTSGGVQAFGLGLKGQRPGKGNGSGRRAAHILLPEVPGTAVKDELFSSDTALAKVPRPASAGDRTARDHQGEEEGHHVANRCKLHALKIRSRMYSKGTRV